MALPVSLERFTLELPYALRLDVQGYVRSVEAALPDIYERAEVTDELVPKDDFLFFVGLWRLWIQVDSQRWIVRNSLGLAQDFGAQGIRAGGFSYSPGSQDVLEIRELHQAFYRWLHRRNIDFVTRVAGIGPLLQQLAELEARGD